MCKNGKCEVVGQTGQGCEAVEKRRDCDAVDRAGGRESETAG